MKGNENASDIDSETEVSDRGYQRVRAAGGLDKADFKLFNEKKNQLLKKAT